MGENQNQASGQQAEAGIGIKKEGEPKPSKKGSRPEIGRPHGREPMNARGVCMLPD